MIQRLWICYLKYDSWLAYRPISRFLSFKLWPAYENNHRILIITIPESEIEIGHKLHPESEPESEIKYFVSNHHPWSFIFKLWSVLIIRLLRTLHRLPLVQHKGIHSIWLLPCLLSIIFFLSIIMFWVFLSIIRLIKWRKIYPFYSPYRTREWFVILAVSQHSAIKFPIIQMV